MAITKTQHVEGVDIDECPLPLGKGRLQAVNGFSSRMAVGRGKDAEDRVETVTL